MDALTRWALVGTARQAHAAADPLAQHLLGKLGDLPLEHRILLAAGARAVTVAAAERKTMQKASLDPPDVCEAEIRPACSARAAELLADILRGRNKELLLEALTFLDSAGQRLPHFLLPAALGVRTVAHRAAVRRVLGERGLWLARLNPAWSWASPDRAGAPLSTPSRSARRPSREELAEAIAQAQAVLRCDGAPRLAAGDFQGSENGTCTLVVHPPLRGVGARAFWLARMLCEIPPAHWTEHFSADEDALLAAAERTDWAAALGEGWTKAALLYDDPKWLFALWQFWQRAGDRIATPAVANAMLVQILQRLGPEEAARCVAPLFDDGKTHIDLSMALCALSAPWPESISMRYIEAVQGELSAMTPRWRAILTSLRDAGIALAPATLGRALQILRPLTSEASPRALVEFMEVLGIRYELVQELQQ